MIKRYLAWLKRRQDARIEEQKRQGFYYAAGALFRGDETPMSLIEKIDDVFDDSMYGRAFDRGCWEAIRAYNELAR